MTSSDTTTRNHWWWRPGWRQGRSFFTWHFLPADQPDLAQLVGELGQHLAAVPQLDPIPQQWLHLTIQGVGFSDEVDANDVARIIEAVTARLSGVSPFTATLGPAQADAEGVHLPLRPVAAMSAVRAQIRAAIGDVWGAERVPESANGFAPHVSLAYANTSGAPLAPLRAMLAEQQGSATVEVRHVTLINLNRDEGMYQWIPEASASLGGGS
jgi:2'-5' RNA ligase